MGMDEIDEEVVWGRDDTNGGKPTACLEDARVRIPNTDLSLQDQIGVMWVRIHSDAAQWYDVTDQLDLIRERLSHIEEHQHFEMGRINDFQKELKNQRKVLAELIKEINKQNDQEGINNG